jgi:hypothetical protein
MFRGKTKLTVKKVERAKPGRHGDGGGLYLEVADGGSASWVYRWERDGREHWLGLGSARDHSLDGPRSGTGGAQGGAGGPRSDRREASGPGATKRHG